MTSVGDLSPLWIENKQELAFACQRASLAGRVAVDTEANSFHAYFHRICLMQMSFADEHVLIDPFALSVDDLAPFAELLADGRVVKVMHGADYDLRILDRDLHVHVANLRDTQLAAQLLGEPKTGLGALIEKEQGITLDKSFQKADWGRRPLSVEERAYAAADTAFLAALADRLAERLVEMGRLAWWEEECAALEQVGWEATDPDPWAFERVKGGARLSGQARDRLAAIFAWREQQAAAADVSPFRVMHGETLLALAQSPPEDLAALAETRGLSRSLVRRHGRVMLECLAHPPEAPGRRVSIVAPEDPLAEKRFKHIRGVRDAVALTLGLDAGVLAPKATLQAIVEALPSQDDELLRCLGRRWRVAVLAEHFLPVCEAWRVGEGAGDAEPH
jgi:ribonuclease D